MPIDSQVEVKQVRLVKGTGAQISAARQAEEILETDLVVQTDAPELVPETRTINNKPLSSNISLDASDVGAVASNTAITGATKCKITYDSKGLVTAGADLNSSDITTALGYTPYNSTNPNGYQANVIETVKVNGTALTPSSKAVNIIVPTNNNQLTNGAGYITSSALSGYEQTSNKVTSLSSSSTNTQYPSAKCVYDKTDGILSDLDNEINARVNMDNTLNDRINAEKTRAQDVEENCARTTDVIPIIDYRLLDIPVQYKGATTQDYINGYFYKFTNPVYSSSVTVQTGSFTVTVDNPTFISKANKTGTYRFYKGVYKGEEYWISAVFGYTYSLSSYGITITGTVNTGDVFYIDFSMETTATRIDVQPSNTGTVTSVNNVQPVNGNVTLTASDVGALPDSTVIPTDTSDLTNGAGFITSSALSGYATQTWVGQQGYLTSTALSGYATEQWVGQQGYITGITSSMVTTALGYTPYNGATNPNGYITGITSSMVTTALGYTPYNGATNPNGYITSSALSGYQTTANLVTSVSSSSTDSQYPSAKLFYDTCGDIETLINAL